MRLRVIFILLLSSFLVLTACNSENDSNSDVDSNQNEQTESSEKTESNDDKNQEEDKELVEGVIEEKEQEEEKEKTQYEKDIEEAIGDNVMSEEEMIEIGKSLLERYYDMYEADTEEEFEQAIMDTQRYYELIMDGLYECCYEPGKFENNTFEYFETSAVQNSENSFTFNVYFSITSDNLETGGKTTTKRKIMMEVMKDENKNKFLIESMHITNVN